MSKGIATALGIALALAGCEAGTDEGLSADEERRLDAAAQKRDEAQEGLETPFEDEAVNAAAE